MVKTIELDCAPCTPRPDTYIAGVLEGTGIELGDKQPETKLFGNWEWNFDEVPDDVWNAANPIIGERIKKLDAQGKIRYGSW